MTRITNPDLLNRKRIKEFQDRYYSRLRNNAGELLVFKKDTLEAWKKVAKAKTRPAFQRRAQEFINLVRRDSYTYKSDKHWGEKLIGNYWGQNPVFQTIKSRGGQSSTPQIILEKELPGRYGVYTAGFAAKHAITLLDRDMKDMKETFIHETLHYIDDMSMTPHEGHSRWWNVRLERLSKILVLK